MWEQALSDSRHQLFVDVVSDGRLVPPHESFPTTDIPFPSCHSRQTDLILISLAYRPEESVWISSLRVALISLLVNVSTRFTTSCLIVSMSRVLHHLSFVSSVANLIAKQPVHS